MTVQEQKQRHPWACQIYHYARRTGLGGLLDRGVCCRGDVPHLQWVFARLVEGHARDLPEVGHLSTPGRELIL